ncbi:AEC family transporter [Parafannyhessea umbonata]|uniref:AEC family transporter n=1 Tax=Parafannyhessea umbonata TaxID=604330 RepID=UPI00359C5B09
MAQTIAVQMVGFAVMLLIGYGAARSRMVTRESLSSIIVLIQKIFLPLMFVDFIYRGMTPALIARHAPMLALAAVFYPTVILAMRLVGRALRLTGARSAAFRMSFVFGNTGFIGLPLLAAIYPRTGAADLGMFVIVDQLVFWTYGVSIASGRPRRMGIRDSVRGFLNPNIVAMAVGFGLVILRVPLPASAARLLDTLGAVASPLCMVALGALCRYSHMGPVLRSRELYVGVAVKMVAMPVAAALLVRGLPVATELASAFLIMMSMPATTLVPLVVETEGGDADYAVSLSVATIAISVVTVPLVALLAGV